MPAKVEEKRFNIQIEDFEGPMELLYYLVRKEEYDIYDLPVAELVDQYMKYIKMMEELELELVGDYLVMAATLLELKARYLLPREPHPDTTEQPTAQQELASMIIEYKKYHALAHKLETRMIQEELNYQRGEFPELEIKEKMVEPNLWELIKSIRKYFSSTPEFPVKIRAEIDLSERLTEILFYLRERKKAKFRELISQRSELQFLVVTFIALLELSRMKKVRLLQRRNFSPIWVFLIE